MIKNYVCEIREQYGEYEANCLFLIRCPEEYIDRALMEVSADWRSHSPWDPEYGGFWFSGNLYEPAFTRAELDEVELVGAKKFLNILWEYDGIEPLPDRCMFCGTRNDLVSFLWNGEMLTDEYVELEDGTFDVPAAQFLPEEFYKRLLQHIEEDKT